MLRTVPSAHPVEVRRPAALRTTLIVHVLLDVGGPLYEAVLHVPSDPAARGLDGHPGTVGELPDRELGATEVAQDSFVVRHQAAFLGRLRMPRPRHRVPDR